MRSFCSNGLPARQEKQPQARGGLRDFFFRDNETRPGPGRRRCSRRGSRRRGSRRGQGYPRRRAEPAAPTQVRHHERDFSRAERLDLSPPRRTTKATARSSQRTSRPGRARHGERPRGPVTSPRGNRPAAKNGRRSRVLWDLFLGAVQARGRGPPYQGRGTARNRKARPGAPHGEEQVRIGADPRQRTFRDGLENTGGKMHSGDNNAGQPPGRMTALMFFSRSALWGIRRAAGARSGHLPRARRSCIRTGCLHRQGDCHSSWGRRGPRPCPLPIPDITCFVGRSLVGLQLQGKNFFRAGEIGLAWLSEKTRPWLTGTQIISRAFCIKQLERLSVSCAGGGTSLLRMAIFTPASAMGWDGKAALLGAGDSRGRRLVPIGP